MEPLWNTVTSLIVMGLPFLAGLYSFWLLSRKDGFDQEKVYDLLVLGILGGLLPALVSLVIITGSVTIGVPAIRDLSIYAYVFGLVSTLIIIPLRWRWSVYRVLDNFSISLVLSMAVWLLMQTIVLSFRPIYFLASAVLFIVNYLLRKYRLEVLKSGYTFSIVSGVFCVAGILSSQIIVSLIFLGLLFTLTLAVAIFRTRGLYVRRKKTGSTTNNS